LLLKLAGAALLALGAGCSGASQDSSAKDVPAEAAAPDDGAPDANVEAPSTEVAVSDSPDASEDLVVLPAQFIEESMPMRMLADGDPVDLWNAPQGGHVILFGAKVRNMTTDVANIKVRFRRPDTGHIVAEEGRSVKMVPVPDEPGMMQPDLRSRSQVANVPLCPDYSALGIVDEAFDVEIFVTALYTQPVQSGTATVKVVARCSTPSDEAFCRCDCGADYVLGKCNEFEDAGRDGPPPRGTDDATTD
jgi:hypothetical protein